MPNMKIKAIGITVLIGAAFLLAFCVAALGVRAIVERVDRNDARKASERVQDLESLEWWKKTNFYHIYVRSFKDSDGDGEGDIRGIIQALDYLRMIGVETLLLSPFYSSPMKDGGYDIDDYQAVNPKFGTIEDVEELFAETKKRNMHVVVDFVPNHSSNQHRWFKCSERALLDAACEHFRDYYVWSNSTRFEHPVQGGRPSNWLSLFSGQSAWIWSPVRKEFYYAQFLPEQPDLNLRNPVVREQLREIARFWLRKGADGLRVDAVLYFYEDPELRDEPLDPTWPQDGTKKNEYDSLVHIYTRSLPDTPALVRDWLSVAEEPEFRNASKLVICEAYESIPKTLEYYGRSPSARNANMPFDFEMLKLHAKNVWKPRVVERTIGEWLAAVEGLRWPNERGARSPWSCWVTGNHDNTRLANRLGGENAAMLHQWLAYLVVGSPVAYYGDELGMLDANVAKIPARTLNEGEPTRLVYRGPMAWNALEPSAGFSTSNDLWLPLEDDYKEHNVNTELQEYRKLKTKNPLGNFMQLQAVRRDYLATIMFADVVFYVNSPGDASSVFAMARTHQKLPNLFLVSNFHASNTETLRLVADAPRLGAGGDGDRLREATLLEPPKKAKLLMLNYGDSLASADGKRQSWEGDEDVEIDGLLLGPSQGALFEF